MKGIKPYTQTYPLYIHFLFDLLLLLLLLLFLIVVAVVLVVGMYTKTGFQCLAHSSPNTLTHQKKRAQLTTNFFCSLQKQKEEN